MSQHIFAVTMPKWGIEMQQGTINEWHVRTGQLMKRGDAMLDVETEKIVNSVEAPIAGTLRRIVAEKGSTQGVGALIAVIADASVSDAEIDTFVSGFNPGSDTSDSTPAPSVSATPADGEVRVSPIARRVAERLGVDISLVKGSGRNGRISQEDVEAFAASQGAGKAPTSVAATATAAPSPGTPNATAANEPVREKMSAMRATIARRLLESSQGIPHYRLIADVDMTALLARRAELNSAGASVSVNDLLVRASAVSLVEHPWLNAQLAGDEILKFPHADIAVAIATDSGLVTPIVRSADTLSPVEIGRAVASLAERARAGRLSREDIAGGTFTVSNLGMFGVDRFDAIINPPQVAILAVGAARDRLVLRNGQPAAVKFVTLTLSCDHRVVDGAVGGRFLDALRSRIENPGAL
jgi:pyruvate dehydrogenase E2 component (dihydrolipoamide acetyltransferase)